MLEDIIEARNLKGWNCYQGYNNKCCEILKDIEHSGVKQLSSAQRLNYERQIIPLLIIA